MFILCRSMAETSFALFQPAVLEDPKATPVRGTFLDDEDSPSKHRGGETPQYLLIHFNKPNNLRAFGVDSQR